MPLLSEFTSYQNWETAAERWRNLLYNHPVSSAIEYFINNLKNSMIILERGVWISQQVISGEMDQNDNLSMAGESYGQIGYEWVFRTLKDKYGKRPMGSNKKG